MKYRLDIDGLRAIAVLSVLFYHAHLGFPGGYVGVDVFFVISGFLITGLLLKAIGKGTFSYLDFWERRGRRLVPALAVVTLFTAVTSALVLLPDHLQDLGGALIAQPLLLSNVYFWRVVKAGYFGDPPEIRPLLHIWSLGVEEQFYVLFPLLLMLILKRRALAPHVGKILSTISVISLGLAIALTPIKGVFSFFMLPTRAWELILGGLLAVALAKSDRPPVILVNKNAREFLALVGLGLIGWSVFFYHHETPFPGYAALVPCAGTALLIWVHSHGSLTAIGRVLSLPAIVRVGQISYSLYLWHWPLIAYGNYLFLLESTEAKWLVVLLSCWLGYLSWRWVETPFREKKALASRPAILGLFAAYAAICIGLGGLYGIFAEKIHGDPASIAKPTRSFTFEANIDDPNIVLPRLGTKDLPASFLLWGDSHAMSSVAPVLDLLGKEHGVSGRQLTRSSKAPLLSWGYVPGQQKRSVPDEFKTKWGNLALETAASEKIKAVFLVGFWQIYTRPSFSTELEETISEFNRRGVQVVFVGDNPNFLTDPGRRLRLASKWRWIQEPDLATEELHREQNLVVYNAIADLAPELDFRVVDLAPTIFDWDSLVSEDRELLYFDDDHLSDAGALKLRPLFEPIVKELEGIKPKSR